MGGGTAFWRPPWGARGGGRSCCSRARGGSAGRARRRCRLRHVSTGEPGVDQIEFVGRQIEALAAAARHHKIAEASGKQIGRGALLEPGVGFADHFQDEAHIVTAHFETALVRPMRDVGQGLGADEIVLVDLVGHQLKQQSIFVWRHRRRLAGVLDAGDGLLHGCGRPRCRARGGRRRLQGGLAWAGAGGRRSCWRGDQSRRFRRGSGCSKTRPCGRCGRQLPRRLARFRGGDRRRLPMTLQVHHQIGRLVGQSDVGGQALPQQLAEGAGAGPASGDGLVVPEHAHGPVGERLEQHGCRRSAHVGDDLRDDGAARRLDLGGCQGSRRALRVLVARHLAVENQGNQVGFANLAIADGRVGCRRVIVGINDRTARVRAQAMQHGRKIGVAGQDDELVKIGLVREIVAHVHHHADIRGVFQLRR